MEPLFVAGDSSLCYGCNARQLKIDSIARRVKDCHAQVNVMIALQ